MGTPLFDDLFWAGFHAAAAVQAVAGVEVEAGVVLPGPFVPGAGAARRRALLTHCNSGANIAAATPGALCEVEGIGKAQAKAIWAYYHPEEKESGGAKP